MSDNNETSSSELRYDYMVEKALLNVVRDALDFAAKNGLPGDHHFYITFDTSHPDVAIPDHLKARYPGEMTIILQYQFWDLDVGSDGFSVTLSFSDVPERLNIPYDAIIAFADPSVRFGLQFDITNGGDSDEAMDELLEELDELEEDEIAAADEPDEAEKPEKSEKKDKDGDDDGSGNVVTLDAFRKK